MLGILIITIKYKKDSKNLINLNKNLRLVLNLNLDKLDILINRNLNSIYGKNIMTI